MDVVVLETVADIVAVIVAVGVAVPVGVRVDVTVVVGLGVAVAVCAAAGPGTVCWKGRAERRRPTIHVCLHYPGLGTRGGAVRRRATDRRRVLLAPQR